MTHAKYLMVGGGLASDMAAGRIRELDAQASITIVTREPHRPYHRPPLTKEYMQGRKQEEEVFCRKADFYQANRIELVAGVATGRLDVREHRVALQDGREIGFDKCLLATGGTPRLLGLPGEDMPGVYHFRTVDDAVAVSRQAAKGRRAVLVGGGFIGMELASSLTQRGMDVTLVERSPHVLTRFAPTVLGDYLQQYCAARGVSFHLSDSVKAISGNGRVASVELESGRSVACDLVVIAAGIDLNVALAKEAGLEVGDGVIVDEHMRTSHADIYAAGDIANYPDPFFDCRRRVEHWGQAEYTGQLAGANMGGAIEKYNLLTYIWTDLFDLHLEFAGKEDEFDQTVIRGPMAGNSFAVLHLKDCADSRTRLRAYYAVNYKKAQYKPLGKLIEAGADLSGRTDDLTNPAFDLGLLVEQTEAAGSKG